MNGENVCDDLLKTPWKKYTSSVPNVPEKSGIYAIGEKSYKDEDIESGTGTWGSQTIWKED